MKKILLLIFVVFSFSALKAQNIERINGFVKELMALESEHVECEITGFDSFLGDIVTARFNGQEMDVSSIVERLGNAEWKFIAVMADDDEGYDAISNILDRHNVIDADPLFDIPLAINQREGGNQRLIFMGNGHTITVEEEAASKELRVLYTNCNVIDVLSQAVTLFTLGIDGFDDLIEDGYDAILDFGNRLEIENETRSEPVWCCGKSDYLNAVKSGYMRAMEEMKKDPSKNITAEKVEEMREELKETIEEVKEEIEELESVSMIENPATRDWFIVMPDEQMEIEKMYGSIYTWINNSGLLGKTLFGKIESGEYGSLEEAGQLQRLIRFITPEDVVMEYMTKTLPKEKWLYHDQPESLKDIYKCKFPGGTPAVIFCLTQNNEAEYKDMIGKVKVFFDLKLKDTYRKLKVVQRSDRNGKRFVQLYGERKTMITILDIPENNVCMMTITVGNAKDFENALNTYQIGGEGDIAGRVNVVIGMEGISFTDEYLHPVDNEVKRNGVHFDFGLKDIFLE